MKKVKIEYTSFVTLVVLKNGKHVKCEILVLWKSNLEGDVGGCQQNDE